MRFEASTFRPPFAIRHPSSSVVHLRVEPSPTLEVPQDAGSVESP
jgi:hypothetical protein